MGCITFLVIFRMLLAALCHRWHPADFHFLYLLINNQLSFYCDSYNSILANSFNVVECVAVSQIDDQLNSLSFYETGLKCFRSQMSFCTFHVAYGKLVPLFTICLFTIQFTRDRNRCWITMSPTL